MVVMETSAKSVSKIVKNRNVTNLVSMATVLWDVYQATQVMYVWKVGYL